jgi:chromate transporter
MKGTVHREGDNAGESPRRRSPMKDCQLQHANHSPSLLRLVTSFITLGLTAFGGPAMAVYISKLAVERNKWVDDQSFRAGVALCQIVPGAPAMQMRAYGGLTVRGVGRAASSFIGFGF